MKMLMGCIYGDRHLNDKISDRAHELARLLTGKNLKIAAAESCTGGWISKICTDLDGSSAWFDRAFEAAEPTRKQ